MIHTEHLSHSYDGTPAVFDLNLHVEPGEILGFLGPNGAGKSTTVKILTGLIAPQQGRATVAGFDVETQSIEVKRRVGYVPETPALYDSVSASEYLELVGCLYHLDPAGARTRRDELLKLFGLEHDQHRRIKEFSKGMRQKVVIASALLHNPDVLILDEPFDGLDANTALVMKELLRQFAGQGKTILFSSHILEVVERICTRIVIINRGRQVADGHAADICASTGTSSLDQAFNTLTGTRDVGQVTADILAALEGA
jgi:ABC-2 type transport system ATP-binding protein